MNNINKDNYNDIINLEHPTSKIHPRLSMESRAAQFAPFAALTGYEDRIKETARITDEKVEIDDGLKEMLNAKFKIIDNKIKDNPLISITYFVKDKKKKGGKYITSNVHIKKIDKIDFKILTKEDQTINIEDIINISSNDITFNFDYEESNINN